MRNVSATACMRRSCMILLIMKYTKKELRNVFFMKNKFQEFASIAGQTEQFLLFPLFTPKILYTKKGNKKILHA